VYFAQNLNLLAKFVATFLNCVAIRLVFYGDVNIGEHPAHLRAGYSHSLRVYVQTLTEFSFNVLIPEPTTTTGRKHKHYCLAVRQTNVLR
jgi:hypothetical protein